jgi:hypothetical protein
VEQFAERYPYFGAAQLLLTKKLQTENPARYTEQLQKTYLFFHNPLWVEQLLNDTGTAETRKGIQSSPSVEIVTAEKNDTAIPGNTPVHVEEINPVIAAALSTPIIKEEIVTEEEFQDTSMVATPVAEIAIQPANTETELPISPVLETVGENERAPAVPAAEEIAEIIQPEKENSTAGIMEISGQLNTPVSEKQEFNPGMPDAVTGNELLFEPYHTVDYFASQGIKFREDEIPKDKFAQQLKSFTGWLRTLKKLPATEMARTPVTVAEHKVEQLAEFSLKEGEIVTETMAEVWEKQGNTGKAIEIYRKLSLLEPAKSTYFAAKIEELKKLN